MANMAPVISHLEIFQEFGTSFSAIYLNFNLPGTVIPSIPLEKSRSDQQTPKKSAVRDCN